MISMRRTIYHRVVAVVLASVLLVSALFTALLYREIARQVRDDVRTRDLLIARVLDEQAAGSDMLQMLTNIALTTRPYRITLIAADGTPLFDSEAKVATMQNHANRPEFIAARATGVGQSKRFSATIGAETYYYAKLLKGGQVLRVAQTTDTVFGLLLRQLPWILIAIAAVALICLVVARRLTRSLVKPIIEAGHNSGNPEVIYAELAPYLREREASDKLRRQFSANVSHELKTPLTSIAGRAELLEAGLVKPLDVATFGRSIKKESQRLLELIEDTMRLSQLDENSAPSLQTFGVQDVIDDVFESLEGKAAAAQVTLESDGADLELTANRSMIFELLYNLVDNAIKYNQAGGTVTVRAARNRAASSESGEETDATVLEVTDTGIGIPTADQERVFERFYRVDHSRSKETGGTGLGLSIVKHIAAQHGAEVELESKPGAGTAVRVRFR